MKKYETVMVFSTAITEEETKALVEKFTNLIAKNGTVESVDEWGKRRLAYQRRERRLLRAGQLQLRAGFPG